MSRLTRVWWCGLVVAALLSGSVARARDVDLRELVHETQRMSPKANEMTIIWWVPEEFWKASLAQTPDMTPDQTEEFLKAIRPYTIVAVVDGTLGVFGGVTYKPENWVRANTRLVDAQGTSYAPKTEVDADTKNLLQMLKPILVNMLGPMGQNMHFLLFPAKTKAGAPIAAATEKGEFKIKLGDREFKWRLPIDALLPVKACGGCKQECKGSWSFCPWCGHGLDQKP